MHLHHVATKIWHQLLHRYPFLRRVSTTTTFVTLIWFYAVYWGERLTFQRHISACDWKTWEQWPRGSVPHHLVFIADPQLVDPHTYPGRPWPLSLMTERYTDLYMARNYRLINKDLDPDSIVFLGDLFDGGREWEPKKPKSPGKSKREVSEGEVAGAQANEKDARAHKTESFALEQSTSENGESLRTWLAGENGRWSKWADAQWGADLERFTKIFFAEEQLYPTSRREVVPAYEHLDLVGVHNGAPDVPRTEYATIGDKERKLIASLPGNHDLGFGALVQLVVRDRFQSHFGRSNRLDIIGNHTFVSVDSPSLSALNQYTNNGYETPLDEASGLKHLWGPAEDFLQDVKAHARHRTSYELAQFFPERTSFPSLVHDVFDTTSSDIPSSPPARRVDIEDIIPFPVVLLSHVPLYRPPDTECGRLRENGIALRIAMGYQYQNVLTQSLSTEIVKKVSAAGEIVNVFSGDDHDYCDVHHRYNLNPRGKEESSKPQLMQVQEITVKSFSWAMGVRRPGFLLVSLWNPVDVKGRTIGPPLPTVQSHLCLLPDQLGIFINYGSLLALTLGFLLLRAVILSVRARSSEDPDDQPLSQQIPALPRFQSAANGIANGYSRHSQSETKGRQRASSTSISNQNNVSNANNNNLSTQRSYNARTRSVSPAVGMTATSGPLVNKAGYFPAIRWHDPNEDDVSDEESHAGVQVDELEGNDKSQAKWKWRRRTQSRARIALGEFVASLFAVGVPSALWYTFLVKNG